MESRATSRLIENGDPRWVMRLCCSCLYLSFSCAVQTVADRTVVFYALMHPSRLLRFLVVILPFALLASALQLSIRLFVFSVV